MDNETEKVEKHAFAKHCGKVFTARAAEGAGLAVGVMVTVMVLSKFLRPGVDIQIPETTD